MEAVLGCFRRLLPEDPVTGGRSLARLGLDGLGPAALREVFARGWESPHWRTAG